MKIDKVNDAPDGGAGALPAGGGLYSDQHLRVSDAEREAVTGRLAEHFAAGRLDQAEFGDRVGRAMSARTRADLSGLVADLPETRAPAVPALPRGGSTPGAGRAGRGRRSSSGWMRPRACRPTCSWSSRSSTRCGSATSSRVTSCSWSGTWWLRWLASRPATQTREQRCGMGPARTWTATRTTSWPPTWHPVPDPAYAFCGLYSREASDIAELRTLQPVCLCVLSLMLAPVPGRRQFGQVGRVAARLLARCHVVNTCTRASVAVCGTSI